MSELHKGLLKTHLPLLPPRAPSLASGGGLRRKRQRDYKPVSWEKYFESFEDVIVGDVNTFRVYKSGSTGPVLLLLHGGGHSALSWAVFSVAVQKICHCQILALDMRGHGNSKTSEDTDLSAETLCQDVSGVVEALYGENPPIIILVGHSMGGAIAVHTAVQNLLPTLAGLAVIDVVEGTALDALSAMQNFLYSRPQLFRSLEHAIEWSIRSGQIHNVESAKVSMVGQLKRCEEQISKPGESPRDKLSHAAIVSEPLVEEPENSTQESNSKQMSTSTSPEAEEEKMEPYTWRIDLSQTEKYWKGWFSNMSKLFLSCTVPKLLLLAGVDRLDRELTIGQMQGKFQMEVFSHCGHSVHEDIPDKVADYVVGFMQRFKFVQVKDSYQRPMPQC